MGSELARTDGLPVDNEGTFVPTAPLHWVKPGQFRVVDAHEHKHKLKTTSVEGSKPVISTQRKPQAPRMDE